MNILKYLDDNVEKILVSVLLGAASIIIGLQVVMRYVMKSSLSWSEEVARYMFIWLTYIGISYGVKKMRHIRVDAGIIIFPMKIRKYVPIVGNILFLTFSIIIVKESAGVSIRILNSMQTSPAIGMPMGYIYMAPLFGFFLASIRIIQNIIKQIVSIKSELLEGEDIE